MEIQEILEIVVLGAAAVGRWAAKYSETNADLPWWRRAINATKRFIG